MSFSTLDEIAAINLRNLRANPYPGRGIFMGMSDDGKSIYTGCWTMGRSAGSRNRVYEMTSQGHLVTAVADPRLETGDSSLTIYPAMAETGAFMIVSNGKQTNAVANDRGEWPINITLGNSWTYEPDSPIFTPRITGQVCIASQYFEFLVQRKSPFSKECDQLYFTYNGLAPGFGRCVTTYMYDGNPPPHWSGEPFLLPLRGDTGTVLRKIWSALNEEHRVSCAVKVTPLDGQPSRTLVINKYDKVTV